MEINVRLTKNGHSRYETFTSWLRFAAYMNFWSKFTNNFEGFTIKVSTRNH